MHRGTGIDPMDLSAVIVNWNSGKNLIRLLDSLAPMAGEFKEIWVVDNGSSDSSLEALQLHSEVRLLAHTENQGFAGAANEGISRTGANVLLLLNPDIEVIPDSVRRLYREVEGRPDAAIVCGSLRDPDGQSQNRFQIRPFPNWKNVLSDVLFLDELMEWLQAVPDQESSEAAASPDPVSSQVELRMEQPAAACWLLRRQAWVELGGFDTRFYPAWFEDVDFCKRIQTTRWQVFYFPHLPFIHRGGISATRLGYPAFVRIFYRNLLKYLKKHHPYSYPVLWLPVHVGMWTRRLLVRR